MASYVTIKSNALGIILKLDNKASIIYASTFYEIYTILKKNYIKDIVQFVEVQV